MYIILSKISIKRNFCERNVDQRDNENVCDGNCRNDRHCSLTIVENLMKELPI